MIIELPDGTSVRYRGGTLRIEDTAGRLLDHIDPTLLRAQAGAVDRAMDAAGYTRDRELLEGVWDLLHALLDEIE